MFACFGVVMGCDIHTLIEVKGPDGWRHLLCGFSVFAWRSYSHFGFLANVRNYSHVPAQWPDRGFPPDCDPSSKSSYDDGDFGFHSHTFVTLQELAAFDYETEFEDRRVTRETSPGSFNGSCLADLGTGKMRTYRDFLGENFFTDLNRLKELSPDPACLRVLMCFDN